jgi:ketosteroid isomerase-like protein
LPQPTPTQQSTPAPNPAVEIGAAVAAYARAIESRDVAAVRRAYPAITATQARGFEQFFGSVRTLKASFTVSGLEVSGSSADARLVGSYDYVTESGKAVLQPVTFQATFRKDGNGWQIAMVR